MLLTIDLNQDIIAGITLSTLLRFGLIFLFTLLLRRFLSARTTRLFFVVFQKFADTEHVGKFKELLQKPIQAILMCILMFIAVNQFGAYFEKIILFQRHKIPKQSALNDFSITSFSLMELIDHIFFFCLIFYTILLLVRVISFVFYIWVERAIVAADRERQQLLPLLRDVIAVLLWCVGFFAVLGVVFHVNVATVIAGLGFGGVAIAFAAKESLENLLASFMIMVDKPFTIGDHIKIGSIEGRAEQIGFRSTRIRTFDQTLVSMPNKNLIGTHLENFSERGKARIKIKLNANYGLPEAQLRLLIEELKNTVAHNEYTIGQPMVYLDNFSATVEINLSYFIEVPSPISLEEIKQMVNLQLYQVMYRHGNGFGFPASVSINSEACSSIPDAGNGE